MTNRATALMLGVLAIACGDDGSATGTDASSSDDATTATATATATATVTASTTAASTSTGDTATTSSSSESDTSSTSDGSSTTDTPSSSSSDASSSDGSSSTGAMAACGDGTHDPDETCDDGNPLDDDGCDADCVPSRVVQLAGDFSEHTCALTRTGAVRCWGRGSFGRLGYGNEANIGDNEDPAAAGSIDLGGDAIQIAAGYDHTCAVLDGGTVRCWGRGSDGKLGYGDTENVGDNETPAAVGDIDVGGVALQVVTGYLHTCALLEGGAVRCWGRAVEGQLGYGDTVPIGNDEPPADAGDVPVGGVGTVVEIAAGAFHTCARLDGGAIRCWGFNEVGELGLGHADPIGDDEPPSDELDVAVLEPGEDDEVVHVAAAYANTCVLLMSGNARCWGNATNGETGYGNTEHIGDDVGETPASAGNISLGGTVVEINAGPCARLDDGAVRCWGLGSTGALGLGDTENIGDTELPSSVGAIELGGVAEHQHSDGLRACAVLDNGDLRCWGTNLYGQLGYGNTTTIGDDPGETPDTVGPVQLF